MPITKSPTNKGKRTKNKSKKNQRENIPTKDPRYPRPLGLTYALHQYHTLLDTHQKQEKLQQIKQLLINQWIANGMTLNNKLIPIQDMSTYLNMPIHILMIQANKQIMKLGQVMDNEKTKDWARAQIFGAFNWGLESQALARHQAHILLAQQGDQYAPFLTSEVNKAIANLTNAQKPIMDILKLFLEKNPTNPLIQLEVNTNKQSNTFITPDEAVKVIRDSADSLITNGHALAAKETALMGLPEGLPNVNARTQDLTAIGLKNSAEYGQNGLSTNTELGTQNEALEGQTSADRHRKRASDLGTFDGEDFEDFVA
jgi:hypothetical protein